ncbi:LEAF RUST 10 DISEASE-RESISTANCE LOCUS RECEPTOR-LIKE PROTEIN KINASE-like 2.4 isoform X1 [Senna tora]|uniref:LEAF RUST 10 DISEASE-RESISTANCE LOCUS RECEPTOR-LIKE PROTEIN KINASE-like 2.4 isoform X1 n=1 Tax=Senna tora TaxID=362788 RepID=A0A834ST26_9FABA|nr:LEAF RUST 10 DISEASE-RESISTANCE LOCUS RECEPTOR-LIKE PROTEIN KINASE-like 2.4 isoform X1 [Senna tora]
MLAPVDLFHFLLLCLLVPFLCASDCPTSFDCGFGEFHFPFTTTKRPDCGLCMLDGCDNATQNKTIQLQKGGTSFQIIIISQEDNDNHNIIWLRDDLFQSHLQSQSCEIFTNNYTLPFTSPLASFEIKSNITLFRCNTNLSVSFPDNFSKSSICHGFDIYYSSNSPMGSKFLSQYSSVCSIIQLPIKPPLQSTDPFTFLTPEPFIDVRLSQDCHKCYHDRRGQCQLDRKGQFYCTAKGKTQKFVFIAIAASMAAGIGAIMVLAYCFRRNHSSMKFILVWKKKNSAQHQLFHNFLRNHGPLPTRYSYSNIKKMTNGFEDKIGQGGYGSVYKGKLPSGHLVAVKVLNKSTDNGEEFINEVASISKTSHINIVSLLGFCFEGSKRALIYEFMLNGSLEKFIREEENASKLNSQLDWETLYDIAVGVAQGLEYLHKGCNTRILHFDIKPHNILLDEDFCPKISDFGLAKMYPKRESVVSMLGARGTIGYIAPELVSRTFGNVSHKSDVYSFGMLMLDIVGGRKKNISVKTGDCTSEIFPDWIYKSLELEDCGVKIIKTEGDKERVRKMIIIGLWCIQTKPSNRPPMSRVLDMLEGKVECIEIPPKPFFSSSTRSLTPFSNSTYFSIEESDNL